MIFELYIYSSIFLGVAYSLIILRFMDGWRAIPIWEMPPNFQPQTKVSVLIPARNESANIQKCVQSVGKQNYPQGLFEIKVIDDHSMDDTLAKVRALSLPNLKILELNKFIKKKDSYQSFKKKAIEIGIDDATGELIVTTDADCTVNENWLNLIVSFYEKTHCKFIAAPVNFYHEKSLLEKSQSLDFLGMMCITGAGIHKRMMNMCNGANLAYQKEAFYEVQGFKDIDQIASGDDVLLMQKMAKRFPHQIGFLKNKSATVLTEAMPDIGSFVNQRIRWASKSRTHLEFQTVIILGLVFLFCVSIVLNFLLLPIMFSKIGWVLLVQLAAKMIIDFFFLRMMCRFFAKEDLMKIFLPAQIFHIVYIATVGFLGNVIKRYQWKGRNVK